MRALEARLKALEDLTKLRFDSVEQLAATRNTALIALLEKDRIRSDARHGTLIRALDLESGLERLERKGASSRLRTV